MKLRIKGNSIRFRLTKTEVDLLWSDKIVLEQTQFASDVQFEYRLEVQSIMAPTVGFESNTIVVALPINTAQKWCSSQEVGINFKQENATKERLSILIEKDFKCLTEREHEDETDMFDNPLEAHNC